MYDNLKVVAYTFGSWDFGDGATVDVRTFRLPPGYKGRLLSVGVSVTETFACAVTDAILEVGTIADPNAYASVTIPDGTADLDFFDQTDDTDAVIAANIAAGSLIALKGTVGAAAVTAAGMGIPILTFEIWK